MLTKNPKDHVLVPHKGRDEFIYLTCLNHQQLRWATVNIGPYIGIKEVFFQGNVNVINALRTDPNLDFYKRYRLATDATDECNCPKSKLVPVENYVNN